MSCTSGSSTVTGVRTLLWGIIISSASAVTQVLSTASKVVHYFDTHEAKELASAALTKPHGRDGSFPFPQAGVLENSVATSAKIKHVPGRLTATEKLGKLYGGIVGCGRRLRFPSYR